MDTLYISLAVGCGLLIVSLLSCCASSDSRRGKRRNLICAFVFTLICFVAQIASIVLFNQVSSVALVQADLVSGTLQNPSQVYYNNAMLSTYVACCTGCSNDCTSPPPSAGSFFSDVNCLAPNTQNFSCTRTEYCTAPTQDGCFVNTTAVVQAFPPIKIDKPVCDLLLALHYRPGVPLVGNVNVTQGGCGAGVPQRFTSDVLNYFGEHYHLALIALGVMCALQGVNLIAQVVMLQTTEGGKYAPKRDAHVATGWNARTDW